MLLLVWHKSGKDASNPQKEDIVVSLYSGADAEYKAELPLMNWLKNDFGTANKSYQVRVIKAGHHGSSAGTSVEFIEALKPDHFLISNGTGHFHPRLEVGLTRHFR